MANLKVSDPVGLVKATLLIGATAFALKTVLSMSGLDKGALGDTAKKIIP
jgi:hypothetical protein